MIPQFLLFTIALAYSLAPQFAPMSPLETLIAHLIGPLVAVMTVASSFPSLSFFRYVNNWIGFALALSCFAFRYESSTALVIQSVVGLWVMAFSILARPLFETGGWRRVIKSPIEDVDLDWA